MPPLIGRAKSRMQLALALTLHATALSGIESRTVDSI
jgi:hypothetical protein